MAVITNPLYFTTLLVLVVSAYFVHKFGLSGPLLQVTGSVYREVCIICSPAFPAHALIAHLRCRSTVRSSRSSRRALQRPRRHIRPRQ
jgi:hypothetical protein